MNKVYVYKEYGIYDYDEFCTIKVFKDLDKAKEYMQKQVEYELGCLVENGCKIKDDYADCEEDDMLITVHTDTNFQIYRYGYGCTYTMNIKVDEMELI